MPSLIGPELQCLQVSYLFHFGFLGPHYFLQEISGTTLSRKFRQIIGYRVLTTFYRTEGSDTTKSRRSHTVSMDFEDPWNMQNLLQANQHLEMTYYGLHPFVKIILDHGSQTSPLSFFIPLSQNCTFLNTYINFCIIDVAIK